MAFPSFLLIFLCVCSYYPHTSSSAVEIPSQTVTLSIPQSHVSLTKEEQSTFEHSLLALSKQAKVTFVVEDAPLYPTPLPETLLPLENLSLNDAIKKVADAYDYSFERKGRVIYLKKRFTNRLDLPCVTLGECRAAVADVLRTLAPYNPNFPSDGGLAGTDPLIADFASSLTSEQEQKMKEQGLPIAALSPEQRQMVYRFALNIYIQEPVNQVGNVAADLECAPQSVLTYHGYLSHTAFSYHGHSSFGSDYFIPFDEGALYEPPRKLSGLPTKEPLPLVLQDGDHLYSLSQLVEILNKISRRSTEDKQFLVDKELADKSVTLIGEEYVAANEIMVAIPKLYGLRLQATKDDVTGIETYRITRPTVQKTETIEDLPRTILSAIPDSLVRAIEGTNRQVELSPNVEGKSAAIRKMNMNAQVLAFKRDVAQYHEQKERPSILRYEAGRLLETVFNRKTQAAAKKAMIVVKNLDRINRNRFALAVMISFFSPVNYRITADCPLYITHFQDVILTGGPYIAEDKSSRYSLSLGILESNTGTRHDLCGASYMRYHMKPLRP